MQPHFSFAASGRAGEFPRAPDDRLLDLEELRVAGLREADVSVIAGIAGRVKREAAGLIAASALVQAGDGRWVTIEAAALEGEREGEVAVQLRSATAGETFELLCRVYALSPRERDVVSLLVAGLDTRSIAKRMFISPHTVQDHLKSVFTKIGIHSRRELLATLSAASD